MSPIESPMAEHAPSQFEGKDEKRLKILDQGIVFARDAREGHVTVENVSADPVIFKVKTTNPEKFRVSPPAGVIRPAQSERITVSFVHAENRHDEVSARDKFLILCKPLGDGVSADFVPIEAIQKDFKQANTADIEQHRLRCIKPASGGPDGSFSAPIRAEMCSAFLNGGNTVRFSANADSGARSGHQTGDLYETIHRLERQVSKIQTLQFVLLAILFLLVAVIAVYVPRMGGSSAGECAGEAAVTAEFASPGQG